MLGAIQFFRPYHGKKWGEKVKKKNMPGSSVLPLHDSCQKHTWTEMENETMVKARIRMRMRKEEVFMAEKYRVNDAIGDRSNKTGYFLESVRLSQLKSWS